MIQSREINTQSYDYKMKLIKKKKTNNFFEKIGQMVSLGGAESAFQVYHFPDDFEMEKYKLKDYLFCCISIARNISIA